MSSENHNAQQTYHQIQNKNRQAGCYMIRDYRKFPGRCHNCGYWGHRKVDFTFLKQDQTEKASVTKEQNSDDVSLINYDTMLHNYKLSLSKKLKVIWIADSGASSHMTNDISGLRN